MIAHEWFAPVAGGAQFCAACGSPANNAPQWCRGRPEAGIPISKSAPEISTRADFEIRLNLQAPRTDAEIRAWRWQNEIIPRLKAAGFDDRFWCEISEKSRQDRASEAKSWGAALNACRTRCRGVGAIIVLAGARGTGKTTIVSQLAIERAWDEALSPSNRQPPYRKLQDLIERYKPLYSDFGSTQTDDLASSRDWFCSSPNLAFIDEIHDPQEMKVRDRLLVDIVDRRYSAKRDTILITNQSAQEFADTANPSIISRLSEHGTIIPCEWKSWRAK